MLSVGKKFHAKSKNSLEPNMQLHGFEIDKEEEYAFKNIDFETYGGENVQRSRFQERSMQKLGIKSGNRNNGGSSREYRVPSV